jgi:hypothetical protein
MKTTVVPTEAGGSEAHWGDLLSTDSRLFAERRAFGYASLRSGRREG